jgi:thymidylate synthase
MCGQFLCCAAWLLGVVWLFGVWLFGDDEAAMATAPHVPATATAAVAAAVSSRRVDFGNRSPFSRSRDGRIEAGSDEKALRAAKLRGVAVTVIEATTIGEAWLDVSRAVLEHGREAAYDGQATRELPLLTLVVAEPASDDPAVAELGDPDWLAWMHDNFVAHGTVAALGNADSYAVRLYDWSRTGRDQVAWVVERLRADPESRSAAITTFQPPTDDAYVPCISMLDFWLPDGRLELVVYAHSLDFGKKAYGNLVELARLQERVAGELGGPRGRLVIHAKSAHVYEPELALMGRITGIAGAA